jgi:hypothetical protein
MVIYWYCANIPPRPLDDKSHKEGKMGEEKNLGPMGEKTDAKDPSWTGFMKKNSSSEGERERD